jgi:hypothetical protein
MEIDIANRNLTLSRRELWRKLTAQFLNDVVQPNIERIGGWQAFLIRRLEHLVKAEHETTLADHVKQIVNEAVELAKSLVMSSTLYALQREERGVQDGLAQKYSNAWMEIIEKSIEHYDEVDFLVSPALVQVANSAGEVFEPLRVIIKAEVCFSKGRSHMYDDSTSKPPTNEEDLVGMTQSGRAIRSVDRLGNVVDEAELNEAIGDEQNEVLDSDSDAYRDESASEVD